MDSNSNSISSSPVEMFFFPFVGGGHQIPMIDIARIFAFHGAKSTIITTPKHSLSFQKSIDRDQKSGRPISIHALTLPENVEIADTDMSAKPFTDTSMLQQPLIDLLLQIKPDCIVHDIFHRWCADAVDGAGITRIAFSGSGCFSRCVQENLGKFKPFEKVGSDFDPFVVPDLPDRIELTRSQLPTFMMNPPKHLSGSAGNLQKTEESSYGTVINSFYDLEPAYVEYLQKNLGKKAWLVGPVSLCNRDIEDKAERGKKTSIDEQIIVSFLNSKKPNSVVYISFGSLVHITEKQLLEIAYGIEASGHSFIWVVRNASEIGENGFEDRIKDKGLIIRGWAPQLLILEHESAGGFVTHCGWNSTLEGVSAGLPMITWPISAEQFSNEKLVTDVLKIGVKAGSMEWQSFNPEPKFVVGRDKVEMAIRRVMDGGEEAEEMRRRAKELAVKAKKAVEEGGSSYVDADKLIQELKSLRGN